MTTATAESQASEPDDLDDVEESQLEFYAREIKDLVGVFSRTLYYCVRGKREKGDIAAQMYAIGNGSMFFMCVTMAFIGAIVAYQMGLQTKKIIPDMSLLGATFLKLQVRDLIASVGAMPLATRVGAGIAAEIGSMVVTEQTDALRMSAADPVDFLVVPRFIASVIMGTVVLCVGGGVGIFSGMLVAMVSFDVNPNTFLNFSMLTSGDVILGLLKMVTYGGTIAIVSSQRGLRTFGGSEGVGIATTEAVVGSLFGIIVWQFILSAIGYVLLPRLIMSIIFENIHKAFGPKVILKGVDLEIGTGECFFIIGGSGVGKSVLIKHLIGLLRPDDGNIYLGERKPENEVSRKSETELYPVRMRCAMVFQNSTLFDSMNAVENVALPLRKHKGLSMDQALEQAMVQLEKVHMQDFAKSFPAELGDGMRKRVAIARALTLDPEYVLFDEPTTSLDPISARRVDQMIRELCDVVGVTSIVVSHDLVSIESISDRIAMLYKGTVRLLGTWADFENTDDPVVRQFIRGEAEGPIEL